MSDHSHYLHNVMAWLEKALPADEVQDLQNHLDQCPECRQTWQELQDLDAEMHTHFDDQLPDPNLEKKVIAALQTAIPARQRRLAMLKVASVAAAILLLSTLGAFLSAMVDRQGSSLPSPFALLDDSFSMPEKTAAYGWVGDDIDGTLNFSPDGKEVSGYLNGRFDQLVRESNTKLKSEESRRRDIAFEGFKDLDGSIAGLPGSDVSRFGIEDNSKNSGEKMTPPPPPINLPAPPSGGKLPVTWHSMPNNPQKETRTTNGVTIVTATPHTPALPGFGSFSGSPPNLDTKSPTYFQPTLGQQAKQDPASGGKGDGKMNYPSPSEPSDDRSPRSENDLKLSDERAEGKSSELDRSEQGQKNQPQGNNPPPQAKEPQKSTRKIIRSGTIEFEIDSFDAAVATVSLLVRDIDGAFVDTVNSEKLPNGKVRGSVVVRVPPDALDGLLLSLRKDLGKVGELIGQRIGSQDITKQYTDLESRLRAARTMEDRLIEIIKKGKGEVKDLLAAEKELGTWRTKIEEYEGELRYYSNLVALSTLTIELTEKSITQAALLRESERVNAGVEVDDVEKAMRDLLKAIEEVKGRVTRSEMKQHKAGQLNAILNFDVAPESAGTIQDRLRQLGNVVRLEIERVQSTDSGKKVADNAKIKRGDTQFFVSLYNLANIAPRETITLRIAAEDVPATFRKLRDILGETKGRVSQAQLNEKDQQNISAILSFSIYRTEDGKVRPVVDQSGEVLMREVNRLEESDTVTDAKVGYIITLLDMDNVQPRETQTLVIATSDVPGTYQKLRDAVNDTTGRILTAQLNQKEGQQVTAQLGFIIRRKEDAAIRPLLLTTGETISSTATRLEKSDNVTESNLGYSISLIDLQNVMPRESYSLTIAAPEVAKAFQSLRESASGAKAQILTSGLNENDQQNVTASLQVVVNRTELEAFRKTVDGTGEVLKREMTRQPESNKIATDSRVAYYLQIVPTSSISPRKTNTLAIEVAKVDDALAIIANTLAEADGKLINSTAAKDNNGQATARVTYDVPLTAATGLMEKIKNTGKVRVNKVDFDPTAPTGKYAIARIDITISERSLLVPEEESLWSQIRNGISISLRGLTVSVCWLIVALLFVLPWVLVIYAFIWLIRLMFRSRDVAVASGPVESSTDAANETE